MTKKSHAGKVPLITCVVRVWSRNNETEKRFEKELDEIWNETEKAMLNAVIATLAKHDFKVKEHEEMPPLLGLEIKV